MTMRPRLLTVLSAAVIWASCGGAAETSTEPEDAVTVVDRNGAAIGWLTADDDSGDDWVSLVRRDIDALGMTNELSGGNLVVATTLDAEMQQHLSDAARTVPDTEGRFEVAAVAVDVTDGGVVAITDTDEGDLAAIRRPTGSVLKFIVATAAIQAGAQASDLIDGGERCSIPTATGVTTFSGDPGRGVAPFSVATANSVNCAFGKLYEIVGGETVFDLAQDMGLAGLTFDTPEIVTGAASASPMEMAAAMRTVLGDGTFVRPFVVERITDLDGVDVVVHDAQQVQVIDVGVADQTASLLTQVVESGTARTASLARDRPAAGKTGTQDGNTDAWMVGGTRQLSVSVWMGNPMDSSDGMINVEEFVDVPRVRGGTYPAAVWKSFLDRSLASEPIIAWSSEAEQRSPVRLFLTGLECPVDGELQPVGLPAVAADAVVESC